MLTQTEDENFTCTDLPSYPGRGRSYPSLCSTNNLYVILTGGTSVSIFDAINSFSFRLDELMLKI